MINLTGDISADHWLQFPLHPAMQGFEPCLSWHVAGAWLDRFTELPFFIHPAFSPCILTRKHTRQCDFSRRF
ncbi:hypothetical protein AGR4C_Lc50158 [Agrobacterium tumefaciens str. Kerr 14]|uniref:Uncharacterized protein n=1 Tax=Agrobacterium tumefaciens str. Kerr 14 TaxID=1183424 RepID=A0A1S7RV85_AGRTU|nr:hypothetical protein AGR4C_Lc50158 [Agrobacterium tumefaciens str. Kerr 14]